MTPAPINQLPREMTAIEAQFAVSSPIPITVVSGFLGAGKTSLVNRLVSARGGAERIGVVVNEAGEIGLDGDLLGVDVVHALDQLDRHQSPEAHQQLQLATHIVLSKIDLADQDAVAAVRARVAALNPDAQIIAVERGALDGSLLLDRFSLGASQEPRLDHDHDHAHDGHDHAHLDVEIFSIELPGELSEGLFESWLGILLMLKAPDLFRIKAILAFAGVPRRQIVHGVQAYVEQAAGRDWAPEEPRTSRLVIIGKDLDGDRWRHELTNCLST